MANGLSYKENLVTATYLFSEYSEVSLTENMPGVYGWAKEKRSA